MLRPLGRSLSATAVLIALALPARGADYTLFVADNPSCPKPSVGESHRAQAVVADMDRYFSGIAPQIEFFEAAFQNGSMGFCSSAEREAIENALIAWAVRAPAEHELQLYNAFFLLGSQRVADELGTRIPSAADPGLKDRLTRAREATSRGVRTRGR